MKYRILVLGVIVVMGVFSLPVERSIAAECSGSSLQSAVYGQKGTHVEVLQTCLIQAGYNIPAGTTGYFGSQTQTAVQSFYRSALGIPDWDGRSIGPKGRSALLQRTQKGGTATVGGLKRVTSDADLKKYLEKGSARENNIYSSLRRMLPPSMIDADVAGSDVSATPESAASLRDRVSNTNVQVVGIDEPDIVKTDGTTIYFSQEDNGYDDDKIMGDAPGQIEIKGNGVTAITAFPLSSLGIASEAIKERGKMLLVKDKKILIILASNQVVAYDITNPKNPRKQWSNDLKNNTEIETARLKDGVVYLVTRTDLNNSRPCPTVPMTRGAESITIPCGDIWVDMTYEPVNQSYTLIALDPTTGKDTKTTTILTNTATVYMSGDNIYLAYRMQNTVSKVLIQYFKNETNVLLSPSTVERIRTIDSYDISPASKIAEISSAIEKEFASLTDNNRMKVETELQNGISRYLESHMRDTDTSTIVRIPLATFGIAASGIVQGHLLNQFSMDEWNGNLRVAVTVGEQWGFGSGKTANDLYIYDQSFNKLGSVLDLGLTERIYAARMIGDRGYVVTFRETDPFYVLDLSNPAQPKMAGELKIPGYSAYLEPLSATRVLGVGQENNGVKISLFDVSDSKNPKEISKYSLKDYWSEVENNHHAFLRDDKHGVFFIPGTNGGYVFSYTGNELTLKATISGYDVKRAVYINDNLYVIGNSKITVLNELTWQEVQTLELY